MKSFESASVGHSDDVLEGLLTHFFEHELPLSLPPLQLDNQPPLSSAANGSNRVDLGQDEALIPAMVGTATLLNRRQRKHRSREPQIAWIAGAVLLALAARLWYENSVPRRYRRPISTQPILTHALGIAENDEGDDDHAMEYSPSPWDYCVFQEQRPLERITYPTSLGMVEQQTAVHWTTVTYNEPHSGGRAEWTFPALTIEIAPVDENEPR